MRTTASLLAGVTPWLALTAQTPDSAGPDQARALEARAALPITAFYDAPRTGGSPGTLIRAEQIGRAHV